MNTFTSTLFLLFASPGADGFNSVRCNYYGRLRPRTSMPPLFYTDIEPEIRSITISPVIHFNSTKISVESIENQAKRNTVHEEASTSEKASNEREMPIKTSDINKTKPQKNHKVTWQLRFNQLKTYKEQNGHCLVPQNYSGNKKLGLWVMQQRRQYTLQQNGKRSSFNGPGGKRRVQELEDIGFVWQVLTGGPRGGYGSLMRMKQQAEATAQNAGSNELQNAVDFEKYMVQKNEEFSDEEVRTAWRERYEIFR